MATPIRLADDYARPDYQHAARLRAAAKEREREFWHDVRLALVGLFGAAVLLGGCFLALVVAR